MPGDAISRGARRAVCGTLLALAGGCVPEEPLTPMPPLLVVHAVLHAGAPSHAILAWWELSGARQPEDGAIITVTDTNGVVYAARPDTVSETPGLAPIHRPGAYRVDMPAAAGATYRLRVEAPGGVVITGETTIPTSVRLRADTVTVQFWRETDTLRLSWTPAPGAARHLVDIRAELGVQFGFIAFSAFADSVVALPGTMTVPLDDDPVFPSGQTLLVSVSAVDSNFNDYYRPRTDPFAGAPRTRLVGGQGVFGSLVPIIVQRLVVDEPQDPFGGIGNRSRELQPGADDR